jgi:hypothetical protein
MRASRRVIVCFAVASLFAGLTTAANAAAPSNDHFEDAFEITSMPFMTSIDNAEATVESNEPTSTDSCNRVSNTVWYRIEVPDDALVTIDHAGTGAETNVWSGDSLTSLVEEACLIASAQRPSVTFVATAGQTYHVQVGSDVDFGSPGAIDMIVSSEPAVPPANDDIASAAVIAGDGYHDEVDARAATVESGEPAPSGCFTKEEHSIWYRFEPSADQIVTADNLGTIDANGQPVTPGLQVYSTNVTSPGFEDLRLDICGEGGNDSAESVVTFVARSDRTYFIQASGQLRRTNIGLRHVLNVATEAAPPRASNDDIADATPVSASGSFMIDARNTTTEGGEPPVTNECRRSRNSVWFVIEPTVDLLVTADTFGSISGWGAGFASLGIYEADGPADSADDLTLTSCGNDSFGPFEAESEEGFLASAGSTYYVQAFGGGRRSTVGLADLHVNVSIEQAPPAPANDAFDDAVAVPDLDLNQSYTDVVDARGATVEAGEATRSDCGRTSSTVWYRIEPSRDVIVRADSLGSPAHTSLALYRGGSLADLRLVTCGGSSYGATELLARAGQTFYLQAGRESFRQFYGIEGLTVKRHVP